MSIGILFLALIAVLAAMLATIAYGTIVKNRWGINFRRVSCPNCGTQAPQVRTPASSEEALWGGYTCAKCGCRMDKWGRRRPA